MPALCLFFKRISKYLNKRGQWSAEADSQAFNGLTVLGGHQEEHPAYEVMRCWCGYLSEVRCK